MALKEIFRQLTVGDRLVIGCLLLVGAVLLLTAARSDPGARVVVQVEERTVFAAPLAEERHFDIPGPLGPTRIGIVDGQVFVERASCPQRLCLRMGPVAHAGEMIACVPNRLLITLEGESEKPEGEYDFLSR